MPPASPAMPLILVVEDEPQIAEVLEGYLRRDGFRTERASDGEQALALHRAARPDLVLLDVRLPHIDGFEVLRRLRVQADTPVILVTARVEDLDRLVGLRLGADDYIVKPFNPLEVVERVKAVLRRARPDPQTLLRLGSLELDLSGMTISWAGTPLELTLTEYRLLEHLFSSPGRVFTRAELLAAALPGSDALERVVDAHLTNLRRKLYQLGAHDVLETKRGVGYRLMGR